MRISICNVGAIVRIANCDLSKCLNKDANKMRIEISDMHDDITQSLARIAKKMRIANCEY